MPAMTDGSYVHGYDAREMERLGDQAGALVDLLHRDTAFPAGSRVLEAGCGVGAQTVTLAARSPGAQITSIDVSAASFEQARERVAAAGLDNVDLPAGRPVRPARSRPGPSTTSSSASCSSTWPTRRGALACWDAFCAPAARSP